MVFRGIGEMERSKIVSDAAVWLGARFLTRTVRTQRAYKGEASGWRHSRAMRIAHRHASKGAIVLHDGEIPDWCKTDDISPIDVDPGFLADRGRARTVIWEAL